MNYYQIFLKYLNEIFVQADYFYNNGLIDVVVFQNKKDIKDDEEPVAFFKLKEIIGCTKIEKEEVDKILNYWKENDDYGKRCDSQGEG